MTRHQGLAIVEELASRFTAGNFDAAFELYHPKLRIVQPASLPHGGVHEGREGVRAMGATFAQFWTRTISAPQRSACEQGVLQVTTQTWTAKATGRSATVEVIELFSFAEGLIKEILVFQHDTYRLMATLDRTTLWAREPDLSLVDASTVRSLAKHWEDGWNGEDVATIVAPFAEDILFSSPYVARIRGGGDSTLRGIADVRQYVADSLVRVTPGIRYTLDASYSGTDTVVLCYTVHHPKLGERSGIDTMRLNRDGKVVEWRCQYPFEA
ncbi:MAG: nuclear transport factor 2 family protein [Polyangiales bacterium]